MKGGEARKIGLMGGEATQSWQGDGRRGRSGEA